MLIALIDDGIDDDFVDSINLTYDLSVGTGGLIEHRSSREKVLTSHGTTCARIINKYAPDAEVCSLRIFREGILRASCNQLVASLEWCIKERIPLINMSVGSTFLSDYEKLRPIVMSMVRQRQIIVAASHNKNYYSIPACFSGVLHIVADANLIDNEYYIPAESSSLCSVFASSRHSLCSGQGCVYVTQVANSYAAPTVTAAVHNILAKREPLSISVSQVYKELSSGNTELRSLKPDFIDNDCFRAPDNTPLLKQHFFFNCVSENNKIASSNDSTIKQRSFVCPNWNAGGFTGFNMNFESDIVTDVTVNNKDIFDINESASVFDRLSWSENDYTRFWTQESISSDIEDYPVIRICGDGLEALDILCRLRKMFLKDGYQCVGISNQPFAYLYGLEYLNVPITKDYALRLIHRYYNPDIVIYSADENDWQYNFCDREVIVKLSYTSNPAIIANPSQVFCLLSPDENDVITLYSQVCEYFSYGT